MINDLDNRIIWYKGELIRANEAKIYALSPTAQFGLNVFEGIPVYHNKKNGRTYIFRIEDHYSRLNRSAKMMELNHRFSVEEMKKALFDTIKANGNDEDLSVRQTLFADGIGSWVSSDSIEMFVSPLPRKDISNEYSKQALSCCISSWRRISEQSLSPRIKCGANYINSRMGQREALRNGYDTCLFMNGEGKMAEGPGSCLFMVLNGEVITTECTDSVLDSITKDTVIQIAKDAGYTVKERHIDRTELYICEEAFLCGSSMEVRPIKSIDGFPLPDHTITDNIRELYLSAAKGEIERYKKWITEVL